jgi:ankyrin repeat protein
MDLLEAVESGDEAGVKRCLDDGADALFADDEGFTCLHMAAQEGYDAIAMMLLRKGALVDATDDSGVTPLMLAAEAGHDVCVAILVKEKANVLLSDKLGKTALFRAVAVAGSAASAKALLDASADASACPIAGKTLVNLAAAKDKECAKLIERALSPVGLAERLLEAAGKGRAAAVAAMLDAGAPLEATDEDGWDGDPETVELLLSKGLKSTAKAKDGTTPIELAEEEEHEEAAEILRESAEDMDKEEVGNADL